MRCNVVLLHAPFFRLVGSHNNRAPMGLCYMAKYLDQERIDSVVLNGDFSPAKRMWRWGELFEQTENFKLAVDGKSAIYGEMIEWVMSYFPEVVVIGAGDSLCPTVDLGNGWVGAELSRRLRKLGVFTVGYGPFYTVDRRFDREFDAVIAGLPSYIIGAIVEGRTPGVFSSRFQPVLPALDRVKPKCGHTDDVVYSSLGCTYRCSFCWVNLIQEIQFFDPLLVAADMLSRKSDRIYFADNVFPQDLDHLKRLEIALTKLDCYKKVTCEARVDTITEDRLLVMKSIGVDTVKLGVELFDNDGLRKLRKHQTEWQIERAVALLKDHGFSVIGYVMLGGAEIPQGAYNRTLKFFEGAGFDYIVVNVCAYDGWETRDYRYDSHFSLDCVDRWDVADELGQFLALQREKQNPTVESFI